MFEVDRDPIDDAVLPWRASGAVDGILVSPHFLVQPTIDGIDISAHATPRRNDEQPHRKGGIIDFGLGNIASGHYKNI